MHEWWHNYGLLLTCTMLATTSVGFALVWLVLRRLPADYFVKPSQLPPRNPALGVIGGVVRNALGFTLLIVGLVMSIPLVPGPGLLSILVGCSLIGLPGKQKIAVWILRLPHLQEWINRRRRDCGQPPLLLPPYHGDFPGSE